MAYKSLNPTFRDLNDQEEREFRAWARENYEPDLGLRERAAFIPNAATNHPIIIEECNTMDREYRTRLQEMLALALYGRVGK